MDVLINIIITITIIIFVLKRMAEVARKGGDITGPPPPPSMFPEERGEGNVPEMRRREIPVREERPERYGKSEEEETFSDQEQRPLSRRIQDRLREAQRRLDEQRKHMEEQRQAAEERFEAARETARTGEYREPAKAVPAKPVFRESGTPERRRTERLPAVAFNRSTLVQGIIMSEILGPPVSLRKEAPR
jgi:hypothetical protein